MKDDVKIFSAPAYITGIKTMSQHWRITIDTQENVPGDAIGMLASLQDKYGYFIFKTTPIEEKDILNLPDFVPVEKNEKTPSQRLRAVLFRLWEQEGKKDFKTSDDYYKYRMDQLIDHYKEKLNDD